MRRKRRKKNNGSAVSGKSGVVKCAARLTVEKRRIRLPPFLIWRGCGSFEKETIRGFSMRMKRAGNVSLFDPLKRLFLPFILPFTR